MRQDNGGIATYNTGAKATITNCYYLTGTCKGGINSANVSGQAEVKNATDMQADSFVSTLNKGNNTTVWEKDANKKNNGYPVLK